MPGPHSCCQSGGVVTTTARQGPREQFLVPGLPYSAAELRGMELSGLLVHVMGDLYLPADAGPAARTAGDGVRMRAAAVLRLAEPVLAGPWAAIGMTAAWVHAGGEAPGVLEASVGRYHRRPLHPVAVGLRLEQSGLAPAPEGVDDPHRADVMPVHGLWCTTIERTVEDLLRTGPTGPERAAAALLLRRCDPARLRERFQARRRRPGMTAARAALRELLGDGRTDASGGGQASFDDRPEVRYTS
ncbi:MAG: hypothetical protein MOP51_2342 [Citricoccus sp.]|nr:hypothetical protein [Citricoccus sp. WCRC_4]